MSEDSAREGDGETARQRTGSDNTGNGPTGNEDSNKETEKASKGIIDISQLSSTEEDLMSHDSHVTETGRSHDADTGGKDHLEIDMEPSAPVLEGTLILTPRRGSETELDMERRDGFGRRFTEPTGMGGVHLPDSTNSWLSEHNKSPPISINVRMAYITCQLSVSLHVYTYNCRQELPTPDLVAVAGRSKVYTDHIK